MRLFAVALWAVAFSAAVFAQTGPDRITAAEAARLEAELVKQTDNPAVRTKLLTYYYTATDIDQEARRGARRRHILWMIEHHPEDPVLGTPIGSFTTGPSGDMHDFVLAHNLWRELASKPDAGAATIAGAAEAFKMSDRKFALQIVSEGLKRMPDSTPLWKAEGMLDALSVSGATATNQFDQISGWAESAAASPEGQRARAELETASNPDLLFGAGSILAQQYTSLYAMNAKLAARMLGIAEECLRRAHEKRPSDAAVESSLGMLYVSASLFAHGNEKLDLLDKAWSYSHTAENRSYVITYLADASYQAGRMADARRDAEDMLQLAQKIGKSNWNYGNLIHDGHTLLGRLELKRDNITAARDHLIAAGKTPGSPQLISFGPKWTLARDLLNHGETNAVLEYVSLCRAFWKSGADRLDEFTATIRGGATPDFDHPKARVVNMAGQAAPGFRLPRLSGPRVSLEDYRGKVIVLDFWATWCGPCRAEMPIFEKLHRELADQDLVILAVNVDENGQTVDAFIKKERYTFPVLMTFETAVAQQYNIIAYPTTVVIDKQGKIADYLVGSRQEADLRAAIQRAAAR